MNRTIEVLNLNARRLRIARERRWSALNEAWGELLGDSELRHEAARSELLPVDGRLPAFFTTARCFFGPLAERVLDEPPQAWI